MPSSCVTVQLGQAGNQVGAALFAAMHSSSSGGGGGGGEGRGTLFREARGGGSVARAVLVDMEPKVVQRVMAVGGGGGGWAYGRDAAVVRQSGSGNNWAYGYRVHGAQVEDEVLDAVRREVERCDAFGGLQVLQSLAGGTGSGLGARMTTALRDAFPDAFLLNQAIWPSDSGEVIVQSYNTALSMGMLLDVSDGVVVVQNDDLDLVCRRLLQMKRPTLGAMNEVLASQLRQLWMPSRRADNGRSIDMLADPMAHLCSQPAFKLLTLRAVPQMPAGSVAFSQSSWPPIVKTMRQMLVADSRLEEGIDWSVDPHRRGDARRVSRSLATWLVLHGPGAREADASPFADAAVYAAARHGTRSLVSTSERSMAPYEHSAVLLANSQAVCSPLDRTLAKAATLFDSGAYLHHYAKYGVDAAQFRRAFANLEQALADYRSLSA